MDSFAERQSSGLDSLIELAKATQDTENFDVSALHGYLNPGLRGRHYRMGDTQPIRMAQREVYRGALADSYDVPAATYSQGKIPLAITMAVVFFGVLMVRHLVFVWQHPAWRPLLSAWLIGTISFAAQWFISYFDRPAVADTVQQLELDMLRVVINVPLFNEEPAIIDRVLWSMVNGTRQPDRIDVVDDCSTVDYTELISYWGGSTFGRTTITWRKQAVNGGKKIAQAATFIDDRKADIFVTVDSDSTLASNALDELLKPFTDYEVQSVAGMVLVHNQDVNWITRTVDGRTIFFQTVACATQSIFGQVLVNRGPLAAYRAQILRDVTPSYLGESFLGRHVNLGDDAALTLFSRMRGRTVQQSTAFSFSVYPETLSHHRRQWTRWMRGSTIRNTWRIKYLSPKNYDWWFTLFTNFLFLSSSAIPVCALITLPSSKEFIFWYLGSIVPWSYITGVRIFAVKRSDETGLDRLKSYLAFPAANLWALLVLRWWRFYGMFTIFDQGWNARQGGAETLTAPTEIRHSTMEVV